MKKILIVTVFAMLFGRAFSQQYQEILTLELPDSLRDVQAEWVDLNNDGLLDILALVKNQSNGSYLMTVKGDTLVMPVLQPGMAILDYQSYALTDYNRDNRIDIVVSGTQASAPVTAVYINQGNFSFDELLLLQPAAFSLSKFADLNNDGRVEWIISGKVDNEFFTNIYREEAGQWILVHDSLKLSATCLEILDADNNGVSDIFISGSSSDNTWFTGFLINKGNFFFKPAQVKEWFGTGSSADINHDGIADVVLSGVDDQNNPVIKIFKSQKDGPFVVEDVPLALHEPKVFVADLSSDGEADFNYLGKNLSGNTINILQYSASDYDTLPSAGIMSQRFGDLEHDGDLDLFHIVKGSSLRLVVMRNESSVKNNGPGTPGSTVALTVFNRLFLYWGKSSDDHTASGSLTYDVFMANGSIPLKAGEFDMVNERRLTVSPGNNGTHHFKLLNHVSPHGFQYAVQSIDNSFHTYTGDRGLCLGGGGQLCTMTETQTISLCHKERVTLTASSGALWFSFADGFLGSDSARSFQGEKQDTVFYFDPSQDGCFALHAWVLQIDNDTVKTEHSTRYACEGATLEFSVEPGWDQVQWGSHLRGALGTTDAIQYLVSQPDSIFVSLMNEEGCRIDRKTALFISKPNVTVAADHYKIRKGGEVQLLATGAARYFWEPAAGLSDQNVPDPVAGPITTTTYTVTGFDSLECTDRNLIVIAVEDAGFIPTLFTPNDDGKNDQLKIYGLTTARDFSFSIYNREGSVVYKASSIPEALNGWDGTVRGIKQPSGVYFWKVKGSSSSGSRLLLNGKDSGSIVLVR